MTTTVNIDAELSAYIECALWSTNADHLDPEGTGASGTLEDHFTADDIDAEGLRSMREDLRSFIDAADPAELNFWVEELGTGAIGHDFWLTRNGHGAGFWDRFYDGPGAIYGRALTERAKHFGESYLYAGGDGKVYVS